MPESAINPNKNRKTFSSIEQYAYYRLFKKYIKADINVNVKLGNNLYADFIIDNKIVKIDSLIPIPEEVKNNILAVPNAERKIAYAIIQEIINNSRIRTWTKICKNFCSDEYYESFKLNSPNFVTINSTQELYSFIKEFNPNVRYQEISKEFSELCTNQVSLQERDQNSSIYPPKISLPTQGRSSLIFATLIQFLSLKNKIQLKQTSYELQIGRSASVDFYLEIGTEGETKSYIVEPHFIRRPEIFSRNGNLAYYINDHAALEKLEKTLYTIERESLAKHANPPYCHAKVVCLLTNYEILDFLNGLITDGTVIDIETLTYVEARVFDYIKRKDE